MNPTKDTSGDNASRVLLTLQYPAAGGKKESLISWLKELFVDIVSSFFPGIIFATYLAFMCFLWIAIMYYQTVKIHFPIFSDCINAGSGNVLLNNSGGNLLSSFSGNSLFTWCFIAFAFMSGFVLQRKDPELPDYVSQIHKAVRSNWIMEWAFSFIYSVAFLLVPTTVLIRVYNYWIYRKGGCCGFYSNGFSYHIDDAEKRQMEMRRYQFYKDGILKNKLTKDQLEQEKTRSRHFVHRLKFIFRLFLCLCNPFRNDSREYIWRLCSREHSGSNAPYERCRVHRCKLTKYPYEDYFHSYLKSRGLTYLEDYVVWDRWKEVDNGTRITGRDDLAPTRSRRVIDLLKNRIRRIIPDVTEDLVRWETHIRLASAIWYLTKFIIHLTVVSLLVFWLLQLMGRVTTGSNDAFWKAVLQYLYNAVIGERGDTHGALTRLFVFSHAAIVGGALFINYSISGFLHYIRLKEVAGIVDWLAFLHRSPEYKENLNLGDFNPAMRSNAYPYESSTRR